MIILFFDTETTGLLPSFNLKPSDYKQIPRIVQLAYEVWKYDISTKEVSCLAYENRIIKPDGFEIPQHSVKYHGITTERAIIEGDSFDKVLHLFGHDVNLPDVIVGHNLKFDMLILGAEIYRHQFDHYFDSLNQKRQICTMQESKEFVGRRYYNGLPKRASLKELYRRCTGKDLREAHNAEHDVEATRDCFFELVKQGVIKL